LDAASSVSAWEVGNNGKDTDDDGTDDDGQATTGFVWQLNLPSDTGRIVVPGAALLADGQNDFVDILSGAVALIAVGLNLSNCAAIVAYEALRQWAAPA
jgi:hypothetical protein